VPVTAKGVVWNTSQNPTITSNLGITNNGTGTSSFTSSITSLTAGTTYYVRAYATNEAGTAYGGEKSFTTIQHATLTTTPISNLTSSSVTTGGNISSDGGSPVTARGVCYSISENPTLDDSFTEDGTGTGGFTSYLTDLTATTTYYVRAYAVTLAGTAYGNQIVFNTISPTQIADIDNNVYNTVTIGDQVWMKENLKTTKFSNGVAIPNVTDNNQWSNLTSYAYSEYDNNTANVSTYGRLYNSYAVFSDNELCPTGWRMPKTTDWNVLLDYLGGSSVAGGKMKEAGTAHWISPNTGATNESGFTGLPGGTRRFDGEFSSIEYYAFIATKGVSSDNWMNLGLSYNSAQANQNTNQLQYGYPVRCLQGNESTYLPVFTTTSISNITSNSAYCFGYVSFESGVVIENGFYYSTTPNAEITGIKVTVASGTGNFNTTLSGLNPNTTYYIKAYAINSNGIGYGEETTFTTLLWTQKANFGGIERNVAVGFAIGDKGYIGTGHRYSSQSYYYNDFWEFDPANNTWSQKANISDRTRSSAVGFAINGKGYIGTGSSPTGTPNVNESLNDFWEYDPSTNSWSQKANLGGVVRYRAVGFSINGKGYIGTGITNGNEKLKDFWEYDPISNTWTQKADFGGTERFGAVGFSIGEKGYVGTGYDGNYTNDFWEYNPLNNTWTQKADFEGSARANAVGFSIGTLGYVGTGSSTTSEQGRVADFWEYDSNTNIWLQKEDFGGGEREYAVGFSIVNIGYVGTGSTTIQHKDFWEYNPSFE
jgi:uncharacterized protein (TIGR02145 family)